MLVGKIKLSASLDNDGNLTQILFAGNQSSKEWTEFLVKPCSSNALIPQTTYWKVTNNCKIFVLMKLFIFLISNSKPYYLFQLAIEFRGTDSQSFFAMDDIGMTRVLISLNVFLIH